VEALPGPNSTPRPSRVGGFLLTLVAGVCFGCGAAERVDEVTGTPAAPLAISRLRSCPEFGWWLILPKVMAVGASADLLVNVSDADTPLDKLKFEWQSSSGSFSQPTLLETRYTCVTEGPQNLQLVATDDTDCRRALPLNLTCVEP
jgi:hypothetical protein